MPNVLVTCGGAKKGAGLTGLDGIANFPDACRRVSCARGGFVSGNAELVDGRALCRVARGIWVVLEGTVPDEARAERNQDTVFCEDCYASLVRLDAERGVGSRLNVQDHSWTARLGPVAPADYTLAVERLIDRMIQRAKPWAFRQRTGGSAPAGDAPASNAPAGAQRRYARSGRPPRDGHVARQSRSPTPTSSTPAASGASPARFEGVVHLADGRPAFDAPVRVRPAAPPPQEGAWRCESPAYAPDVFTSRDGAFTLWVDPGVSTEIEAGSSWDPDGHAILEIPAGATEIVELRLTR
jgi:hypothetical protein